jgi:catechol 2,3-dioxygenase-like lactoylglutathione lyase family enzyme
MAKKPAKKSSGKASRKPRPKAARRPVRKQPESLRIRESSFSLTVNDLDRSVAWYRDVLGFTEGERWETEGNVQGVQLKAGSADLMLTQDDFAKGRDRHKGVGIRLWFSTTQHLDGLADLIRSRGGALEYGPGDTPWGDRAFGVTDPDGFSITFVETL